MKVGLTTWAELAAPQGPVVLVVNGAPDDADSARSALDALSRWAGLDAVHVVAGSRWQGWLGDAGVSGERVLPATDDQGRDIELTNFLHSAAAIPWFSAKKFRAVMGTKAHNLYNEEVQDPFERRIWLLLGDGRMIAHALPSPYICVFDTAALIRRAGRARRVAAYARDAKGLVDALRRQWENAGSPRVDDSPDRSAETAVLAAHLRPDLLAFDERSATTFDPGPADASAEGVAAYLDELRAHVCELDRQLEERRQAVQVRDTMLAGLQAERNEAVQVRETMIAALHAERNEAVQVRETMLAALQAERNEAVQVRETMLAALQAERNEAVAIRDRIIEDLRLKLNDR